MKYEYNGPEENRPMSPWSYFGHQVLYALPIVGWIFLIIHAISAKNINKKNFARSYFCVYLIAIILIIIIAATGKFADFWAFMQTNS